MAWPAKPHGLARVNGVVNMFETRACPNCACASARALIDVSAKEICRSNWSYRPESLTLLGVNGDQVFPIVECTACGFVFAPGVPGPAFLCRLYDEVIDVDLVRRRNFTPETASEKMLRLSQLLRLVPKASRETRVLDYGCGLGLTLRLLAQLDGISAVGLDSSSVRCKELRRQGLNVVRELNEIPVEDVFDAVVLDNVLEHVPAPEALVRALRERVEDGAVLFLSVPDLGARNMVAAAKALSRGKPLPMDINPWEHLNYFNRAHADAMMARAGFRVIPQAYLPWAVDVGLRPSGRRTVRLKNAIAAVGRIARYVTGGNALSQVTARFYRAS